MPAQAADWEDIKDPAALRALYSNKTFKRKDQVCVKLPWDSPCYRFQRHKAKPAVYRSINVANDTTTEFIVEDGVPQF